MLQKARYLTISAFFVLVFVLFLTFNPGIYSVTGNVIPQIILRNGSGGTRQTAPSGDVEYAVITGAENESRTDFVSNTLLTLDMLKREYAVFGALEECAASEASFGTIIIASPDIEEGDAARLGEFLESGGDVVFASVPESASYDSSLRELMGITDMYADYEIEGFDIYPGVLIGGRFTATEWSFECPRVWLAGTCKVYANGHDPERDKKALVIDPAGENPIIWRTYYGGGAIYVINAPFMQSIGGTGVLTGVLALDEDDFIYPIAGAKTVLLKNFPIIANENRLVYGRSVFAFSREILWPDLIAIANESYLTLTGYTNGGFSQNGSSDSIVGYFADESYKSIKGELAYLIPENMVTLGDDMSFFRRYMPYYTIRSLFSQVGSPDYTHIRNTAPDMTSIILPSVDADAFTWITDQALALPVISSGVANEQENLNAVGAYSAMGLMIHSIDMAPPVESVLTEDEWNNYALEIAKYFSYLFKNTGFLPSMTMSHTAEAVKNYLNTGYGVARDGDKITVSMERNNGEISFILKTRKLISYVSGCYFDMIEDGAYLIRSSGPEFEIYLK